MLKIFKYELNRETRVVNMPVLSRIIRVAHVDDNFYKGDFVWAIIDTEQSELQEIVLNETYMVALNAEPFDYSDYIKHEIRVKEKQEIEVNGFPVGAHEDDGKLYVYIQDKFTDCTDGSKKFKIAMFKTGQEIDIPLNKMVYLGLNRLWIIQELGLYTFLYND